MAIVKEMTRRNRAAQLEIVKHLCCSRDSQDSFAVKVMNRFKELDLINSVSEELWIEVHNLVQEMANKTI